MAEVELKAGDLRAGIRLDLLTRHEVREEVTGALAMERERLAGIKTVRFQAQGTVASSAFSFGGADGQYQFGPLGPEQGYVWSVRALIIQGLTASSTAPDICNIKRSGTGDLIIWQLNGNQFCQTWGRGEELLYSGEMLKFVSSGTIAATGQIIAHGMAENVPAEMIGKFY